MPKAEGVDVAVPLFEETVYRFHDNEREHGPPEAVPDETVERVEALVRESWASEMKWL